MVLIVHVLDRDRSVADAIASVAEAEGLVAIIHDTLDGLTAKDRVAGEDMVLLCDYIPGMSEENFVHELSKLPETTRYAVITNGRTSPPRQLSDLTGRSLAVLRKPIYPRRLIAFLGSGVSQC